MPRATAKPLHQRLVAVAEAAQAIDVRRHETGTAEAAMRELVPRVRAVVTEARDLALAVLGTYERIDDADDGFDALDDAFGGDGASPDNDFYRGIDELVEGEDGALAERVADIAFMALTELRQKSEALEHVRPTQDGWEIVAACGSALRRVAKSFTALEVVLCHTEGLDPQLAYASELTTSLEVRRQYGLLRHAIQGHEPSADSIRARLRAVGTRIAMLVGRDIYTDLRVHDRIQIRRLQQRILDWLRKADDSTESWVEGRRLWQDLVGFADLIHQVSRRQELAEHDALRLRELLEVARSNQDEQLLRTLAEHGRSLEGLDDELDAQLAERTPDPKVLRTLLQRLGRDRSGQGPRSAGDWEGGRTLREPAW